VRHCEDVRELMIRVETKVQLDHVTMFALETAGIRIAHQLATHAVTDQGP
jgi:hypothetical protein